MEAIANEIITSIGKLRDYGVIGWRRVLKENTPIKDWPICVQFGGLDSVVFLHEFGTPRFISYEHSRYYECSVDVGEHRFMVLLNASELRKVQKMYPEIIVEEENHE